MAEIRDGGPDRAGGGGAARLRRDPDADQRARQQTSHEAGARQIYQAYNDLEFRNPQYARPDLDRLKAGPATDLVQYESFVSYFLYACEEAVGAFHSRREWQATCDYDLKGHLPFLCEKAVAEPVYLTTYSGATQRWIDSEMRRLGVSAPDCKVRKT